MNFKKLIAVAIVGIGLCGLAYYPLMEWKDARDRRAIIDSLDQTIQEQTDETIEELKKQAQEWNKQLAGLETDIPSEQILPYEQQLKTNSSSDLIGYVKIPSIDLEMPIYHDTKESTLAQGAGHLKTTSLPIGGSSSHSAVSAHSGMPNEKAFDDLRELKKGDYFAFNVLNDWYGYQVESIETVLPEEVGSLDIVPGEDRSTLITCTPYGINDHRLLVHGVRAVLPDSFFTIKEPVAKIVTNRRNWPVLLAISAVVLFLIGTLVLKKHRKKDSK